MEAADHVDFGDADIEAALHAVEDFINGHLKGVLLVFARSECAELAAEDAVVGVVDVEVVDVGADVPVLALADDVGDCAEGVQVAAAVEGEGVGIGDALAVAHLVVDRL